MSSTATQRQQPNPAERVMQVTTGFLGTVALNAAVEINIPDLLAGGPRPVSELARATATNEDALYRTLRAVASLGIFTESEPRKFANTPESELLRAGAPGSLRDMVRWFGDPFHFRIFAEYMHSVKTGKPCFDKVMGKPIFEYFPSDPRESEMFNNAMTSFSAAVIPAVLEAYDFSGIRLLVDVAGGHGQILFSVLKEYPQMRGILSDLPHVLEGARPRLRELGLESRCRLETCDFFKSVPAGGDAYIMKHIIHDWDDDRALTILRNIHQAAGGAQARVILLEGVISPGNESHFGKFLDLEMLALPSGRERTEDEFRALFDRAGFRLTRVVQTPTPMCVIEAEKK